VEAAVVAAAAAVVLMSGSALAYYTPVSYASVDINPSIEFRLNILNHVLSARGVNADGVALLAKIKTGTNLGQNIKAVVREAVELGYLKGDDNTVVVTLPENEDEKQAEQAKEQAEKAMEEAGTPGEVVVDRAGYDRVLEARTRNTTPGKLNLVQKYIDSAGPGAVVDIDEWLKKPVKEIMKAIKENRKAAKAAEASASPAASESPDPNASVDPNASMDPYASVSVSVSPSPYASPTNNGNKDKDKVKDNNGNNPDKTAKPSKTPKPDKTPKPSKTPEPSETPKPSTPRSTNGNNGNHYGNDNNDKDVGNN
jgi:hypothetical protein